MLTARKGDGSMHHYWGPAGDSVADPVADPWPPTAAAPGGAERRATLAIGSVYHINGLYPDLGDSCLLLVEAPPPALPGRVNTIWLSWDDRRRAAFSWVDGRGEEFARGETGWDRLFLDGRLGPEVIAAAGERLAALPAWRGPGSFVPLFFADVVCRDGPGLRLESPVDLFSQLRFTPADALFIRTNPEPYCRLIAADPDPARGPAERLGLRPSGADAPWREAIRLHGENFVFLNNHQCYYTRCFPGQEVEYKLDLEPPVDIWGLTMHFYGLLRGGGLPGYRPEYRDEYQAWDYMNHLYEVTAPEKERGYVSFIPCTNGRCLVKRKHYTEDALVRGETHERDVAVDLQALDDYAGRYGERTRRFPPFRRVRYDVNLESLKSGHVYGVFFDHSSIVVADGSRPARPAQGVAGATRTPRDAEVLMQCEIEYLRSRTVVPPDPDLALEELAHVAAWTRRVLDGLNVRYRPGFYSKLSFLKHTCSDGR